MLKFVIKDNVSSPALYEIKMKLFEFVYISIKEGEILNEL